MRGTIKSFDKEKREGFIKTEEGVDIDFGISDFRTSVQPDDILEGRGVIFDLKQSNGTPILTDIEFTNTTEIQESNFQESEDEKLKQKLEELRKEADQLYKNGEFMAAGDLYIDYLNYIDKLNSLLEPDKDVSKKLVEPDEDVFKKLAKIGKILIEDDDYENARDLYNAIDTFHEIYPEYFPEILDSIKNAHQNNNDFEKALKWLKFNKADANYIRNIKREELRERAEKFQEEGLLVNSGKLYIEYLNYLKEQGYELEENVLIKISKIAVYFVDENERDNVDNIYKGIKSVLGNDLDISNVKILNNFGKVCKYLGEYKDASDYYLKVLELDKDNKAAENELFEIVDYYHNLSTPNLDKAIEICEAIIEKDSENKEAFKRLAKLHEDRTKATYSYLTHQVNNKLATTPYTTKYIREDLEAFLEENHGDKLRYAIDRINSLHATLGSISRLIDMFRLCSENSEELKRRWECDGDKDITIKDLIVEVIIDTLKPILFSRTNTEMKRIRQSLLKTNGCNLKEIKQSFQDQFLFPEIDGINTESFFKWLTNTRIDVNETKAEIFINSSGTRHDVLYSCFSELVYNAFKYNDGQNSIKITWSESEDSRFFIFTCENSFSITNPRTIKSTSKGLSLIKQIEKALGDYIYLEEPTIKNNHYTIKLSIKNIHI